MKDASTSPELMNAYAECCRKVHRLHGDLLRLAESAEALRVAPPTGREWYELLTRKLLPQLADDAYLVVAVVGGTNIGKSVIFNHIAGCRASATSPMASGTKHPVCLVPVGFPSKHDLAGVFPGFQLEEWTSSEAALEVSATDRLFWRESDKTPENLLVLDTPDIDSDALVNWERADHIRRCADVLIAVLTQQKYNDAAVKQFFRRAAAEDKAVIVVFNQCMLPEDEEYWPQWLATFCRETGIEPVHVYVAPSDRRAAEENRLEFRLRPWPGAIEVAPEALGQSRSLLADLSQLHFGEIKLRSLRGSLNQLLDTGDGAPAWLDELRQRSEEFQSAAELLATHSLAQVNDWPAVPNGLLVGEIRHWWQRQREGWSGRVHGFYNTIGSGLAWPFRTASRMIRGERPSPWQAYHHREWDAVVETVSKVYERLTWISQLGNELLRPRLEAVLRGTSRAELIEQLRDQHAGLDLQQELAGLVAEHMHNFRAESPQFYRFLKHLDSVAAAARPAVSVVFFVTGFGPAGHAAAGVITDAALQSAIHLAGDVAGGTLTAAVGETAVSRTTAAGMDYLQAKFRKIHTAFTARRADWLAGVLRAHLLGTLPEDIARAAGLPGEPLFQSVAGQLEELERTVRLELPESVE